MDKPLETRMTELEKEIAELKEQVSKQPEEMKEMILNCMAVAYSSIQQCPAREEEIIAHQEISGWSLDSDVASYSK